MNDPYVESLLEYAKNVVRYGLVTGTLKNDELPDAIAAVDRLEAKRAGEEAVVKLKASLIAALGGLPSETRIALRPSSWFVGPEWRSSLAAKLGLIFLSILLMLATGRMTFVHKQGISIAQELDNLTLVDPERTLNQLVWTIAQANEQMQSVSMDEDTEFDLARNASDTALFDLKSLSDRVSLASSESQIFLYQESIFPIWPMSWAYCHNPYVDRGTPSHESLCGSPELSGNLQAKPQPFEVCTQNFTPTPLVFKASAGTDPDTFFHGFRQQMEAAERNLVCSGDLKMPLANIPSLRPSIPTVNERVELYAFWFLPALYGMMGVVIYQLRLILDPMRPTRPWYRFVHRVVLGGLAGIVLGWFFAPSSQLSSQLSDIGFGLFGLAFLFGYSIDIFFALLDRLVMVSVGTIERFGETRPVP